MLKQIILVIFTLFAVAVGLLFTYLPWYYAIPAVAALVLFGPTVVKLFLWLAARTFLKKLLTGLAMGGLPERVTLEPCGEPRWENKGAARSRMVELRGLGFEPAGTYRIPEMPSVTGVMQARTFGRPSTTIRQS